MLVSCYAGVENSKAGAANVTPASSFPAALQHLAIRMYLCGFKWFFTYITHPCVLVCCCAGVKDSQVGAANVTPASSLSAAFQHANNHHACCACCMCVVCFRKVGGVHV
jgi:hypothetical protein